VICNNKHFAGWVMGAIEAMLLVGAVTVLLIFGFGYLGSA
jgi:hypothetical protein